jgi:hypothetical protein
MTVLEEGRPRNKRWRPKWTYGSFGSRPYLPVPARTFSAGQKKLIGTLRQISNLKNLKTWFKEKEINQGKKKISIHCSNSYHHFLSRPIWKKLLLYTILVQQKNSNEIFPYLMNGSLYIFLQLGRNVGFWATCGSAESHALAPPPSPRHPYFPFQCACVNQWFGHDVGACA